MGIQPGGKAEGREQGCKPVSSLSQGPFPWRPGLLGAPLSHSLAPGPHGQPTLPTQAFGACVVPSTRRPKLGWGRPPSDSQTVAAGLSVGTAVQAGAPAGRQAGAQSPMLGPGGDSRFAVQTSSFSKNHCPGEKEEAWRPGPSSAGGGVWLGWGRGR